MELSEKIESMGQSRSELTLFLSPADHGATYRCRSFASQTMTRPVDSDESVNFNVTCKNFIQGIPNDFKECPELSYVIHGICLIKKYENPMKNIFV